MSMITPPPDPATVDVIQEAAQVDPGALTAVEAAELGLTPTAKPRSMLRRGWEVFAENKLALTSVVLVVLIAGFCYIGPLIYHTNQVNTNLANYLCRPSAAHPLGCNDVDAGLSLPYIMVIIILSVIFHPSTITMIFIIAVFYWLGVARLVRGETLTLRTREYVQAVKVLGGNRSRAITRHIVPNAIGTIIVQATFAVADSILILSGLGFLGYGIQAPATDWGSMLSNGVTYLQSADYWWLIYPPGIAIILTCIAFNFIGDALRDAFETRLQRR